MTELEAQNWLAAQGWFDGAIRERLAEFVRLVVAENAQQNLIAASTLDMIWARHIVDSAQLLNLTRPHDDLGEWIDLGSGGGFPGIVIACITDGPIALVETRDLRVDFLTRCVAALGLTHARVLGAKVEQVRLEAPASIISARAFAPLPRLFAVAQHLGDKSTTWLLPKGRNAELELESVRAEWQAVFHVEQSVTDVESKILVVEALERRRTPVVSRRHKGSRRG